MSVVCPCRKFPCIMCELTEIQKKLKKQSPYKDKNNFIYSMLPNKHILLVDGLNHWNRMIVDPDHLERRQPDDFIYNNFLLPPDPIVYVSMGKAKLCNP